ncbi:MAG: transglycosylase SLT domain-containing protein [Caldilineaceae bacterium]
MSLPYRTDLVAAFRSADSATPQQRKLSGDSLLRAQDGADACHVAFHAPRLRQIRPQQAMITIPPGRVTPVALHVYAQSQAWFGRSKRSCPLQLTVTAKAAPPAEQRALVKLALAPVIGPWQVAALFGLFSFVVTGVGLGGLAMVIALMMNMAQPSVATQPLTVSAVPAAPPSIVTILVQPAVSAPGSASAISAVPPVASAVTTAQLTADSQPEVRNLTVPLVQPEQISAPNGEAGSTAPDANQAIVAAAAPVTTESTTTAPATTQTMTYAQMFQEVALRYDLHWRMLAAQAYVESSFDSLALGSHGDLGLMQIQPATWREWAPTVAASDPFDSYNNALVAAVYLDYLRTLLSKQGHPEREWMLVAYNWGPDKVLQHLEKGGTWDDLRPDLRQYAEEILRLAETIPPDAAF